jgi:glycosyltransferase involved in cell wall biosynthesis
VLYPLPADANDRTHAESLARAIETLGDPSVRRAYGAAARERALRDYSWSAHCRALEEAIRGAQCEY